MVSASQKLQDIINYFEYGNEEMSGWSKEKVIFDILSDIKELEGYNADEIVLERDGEYLTTLDVFVEIYFQEILEKFCNVVKSFKGGINDDRKK